MASKFWPLVETSRRGSNASTSSMTPNSTQSTSTMKSNQIRSRRRYLLKITPIEAQDLLPCDNSNRSRNAYCTMVLLDRSMQEIKGEKHRTPAIKQSNNNPVWSPLKQQFLKSKESSHVPNLPLGISAAAAVEEYTFGLQSNLASAKYLLVKCKDKNVVENENLGRLLLAMDELNMTEDEVCHWYDLQVRPHSKMTKVTGRIKLASRVIREPNLHQLWSCAVHMMKEIPPRTRSLYLKSHPNVITGKEAIEWMLCHGLNRPMEGGVTCSTEEEAMVLGTCLLRAGILVHVSGDRRLVNSSWKYYRFAVNHLDPLKQKDAVRQMNMVLSGEIEEIDEPEDQEDVSAFKGGSIGGSSISRSVSEDECELVSSMSTSAINRQQQSHSNGQAPRHSNITEGKARSASTSQITKQAQSFKTQTQQSVDIPEDEIAKSKSTLKIEDFELLHVLGTGSFGRVVSARGPKGRIYAIKIISKIGMDDNMRRNAKLERDVLRDVRHPFVASLAFAFQNEDKIYMGMTFYNGGDLRLHLNYNANGELKLTPRRIKLYAAELVAAIAHLHSVDIIYRDLKPENVMIAKDGHIVLVDFGLSTYGGGRPKEKETHSLAGSPAYIAPEVLAAADLIRKGKKGAREGEGVVYGSGCDWWSLGILLFEMFTGRTPFYDENRAIMYKNIKDGPLYIPSDLPEDAQRLLAGLIERDLTKRLGAIDEGGVPSSIMNHEYFNGINWELLQQKRIEPDWIPDVVDDADAKYVENDFNHQVPIDTPEWRMLDAIDRAREFVDDFTYRATQVMQK